MVTGDAPATAAIVAKAVGVDGVICPPGPISDDVHPEQFAVFAGVLPEDKYKLVKAFQKGGHTVGMCGDGANDAPALRQVQMGIAVSMATDALAIAEAGGEIHKYVGDEIIATWTLAAGLNEGACVRACFAALDRLAERGPAYERDFGCRADFRAGLHCGSVVIGELGYLKKEIALNGDSMNTAARIQEACRATGCRVLASAVLIERIGAFPVGVTGRSLGPLPMRGKEQSIVLYALETVDEG